MTDELFMTDDTNTEKSDIISLNEEYSYNRYDAAQLIRLNEKTSTVQVPFSLDQAATRIGLTINEDDNNSGNNNKETIYKSLLALIKSRKTIALSSGIGAAFAAIALLALCSYATEKTEMEVREYLGEEIQTFSYLFDDKYNTLGPYDELGQRLMAHQPLVTSDNYDEYPFNEEAIQQKQAAQEKAEAARIAAEEAAAKVAQEKATAAAKAAVAKKTSSSATVSTSSSSSTASTKQASSTQTTQSTGTSNDIETADTQAAQAETSYSCVIQLGNKTISYVSCTTTPASIAGLWRGTGDVNDGKGSYFVGHNPGVFSPLISNAYGVGSTFIVYDSNGDSKTYTITDCFEVDEGSRFDSALQKRTIYSGGETACLQTCINGKYRIFVGH